MRSPWGSRRTGRVGLGVGVAPEGDVVAVAHGYPLVLVAVPGFAPGRPLGHAGLSRAWLLFHQTALVAEAGFEPAFSRL